MEGIVLNHFQIGFKKIVQTAIFVVYLLDYTRWVRMIELGLNKTSTLVGHFVSSPREREGEKS